MSGEATPRATAGAEALDRAFGAGARCNTCAAAVAEYRVVALFLHDTAVVRAYCGACYPAAADGDYHAAGDGILLDYAGFVGRFGAPGPPPPPATPVDRLLAALLRDPALRSLSPPTEALARKRRQLPYRVRAAFAIDGAAREVTFTVSPDGRASEPAGDPAACARVRTLLGAG